ncbi:hypothetical protein ACQP2K_25995 [Microbispora siamensis]
MAWQLHYTSAEAGPTGRAGFQFVARTAGVPDEAVARVAPYLTYRPPPGMPTAPSPDQIAAMPVALTYGPAGDRLALTRCVYLGQDYSGRFGNFLGHALLLDEQDLIGMRPIELWQAPVWSDRAAEPGAELPEVIDLAPGPGIEPESLGLWLRDREPESYTRLGVLLELSRQALSPGRNRLVLVSADSEEIVRWIAVISYSLPWETVGRLSFCTYSGDPATTAQLIVGTTPDVWLPSDLDATVVALNRPAPPVPLGRFARTVTELWRRMDLAGIDDLSAFGEADPEVAAALVTLCRSDDPVPQEEQSAVAALLSGPLPEWVWPALARRADLLDHELAAAVVSQGPPEAADPCAARCVLLALREPALGLPPRHRPGRYVDERHLPPLTSAARSALRDTPRLAHLIAILRIADLTGLPLPVAEVEQAAAAAVRSGLDDVGREFSRTPLGWRGTLLTGLARGIEEAPAEVRAQVLAGEICDLLGGLDLRDMPFTAIAVTARQAETGRVGRVEATVRLVRLARDPWTLHDRDLVLAEIWRAEPTADDCAGVVESLPDEVDGSPVLSGLPARTFVRYGFKSQEIVRIARMVLGSRVTGPAADDARAVLAAVRLSARDWPADAADKVVALLELTRHADPGLAGLIRESVARTTAGQPPLARIRLLLELPAPARDWLVGAWLARKADREEQAALLEIAIRLRSEGAPMAPLEERARTVVNAWARYGALRHRFERDPELAAGLKEFMRPKRRFLPGRGR